MGREDWRATVHGVISVGHDLETKPPPPPGYRMISQCSFWLRNHTCLLFFTHYTWVWFYVIINLGWSPTRLQDYPCNGLFHFKGVSFDAPDACFNIATWTVIFKLLSVFIPMTQRPFTNIWLCIYLTSEWWPRINSCCCTVVQSLSRVWHFATPYTVACQASLSFTIS